MNLMDILQKLIDIAIIIVVTVLIDKIIDIIIYKTIKIKNRKNITTMMVFFRRIKRIILYSIGLLVCLSTFEIFNTFSVTLLSGLGIGSVVLGLAAQESLKNFFGTISIVMGSPFEVGDFIECTDKGVSGTVEDITMRHTVIKTINNRRVLIPNGEMNYYTIENFNYKDNESVKLVDYEISYESDVDKAIKIIKKEMQKLYRPNPKGKNKNEEFPKVRLYSWEDSGIKLRAWIWGKDLGDASENVYKLNYSIKKAFEKENIEIPYPHVEIVSKQKSKKAKE